MEITAEKKDIWIEEYLKYNENTLEKHSKDEKKTWIEKDMVQPTFAENQNPEVWIKEYLDYMKPEK
jgi:hypothetical protein